MVMDVSLQLEEYNLIQNRVHIFVLSSSVVKYSQISMSPTILEQIYQAELN